ncbi:hypothetical protein [Pseudoalteromonas nigrifaciens]|uniref:hypothetical protein n=1 Tax=Pseudoalteromonas nigrifaciens TaxID=28109 RepID=UPI001867D9CF|nr:hypothetical protein [Pseudoalteromonas nigrifaciens]
MWHYKNLGDAMFADAELAKIKQLAMATNAHFTLNITQKVDCIVKCYCIFRRTINRLLLCWGLLAVKPLT